MIADVLILGGLAAGSYGMHRAVLWRFHAHGGHCDRCFDTGKPTILDDACPSCGRPAIDRRT